MHMLDKDSYSIQLETDHTLTIAVVGKAMP